MAGSRSLSREQDRSGEVRKHSSHHFAGRGRSRERVGGSLGVAEQNARVVERRERKSGNTHPPHFLPSQALPPSPSPHRHRHRGRSRRRSGSRPEDRRRETTGFEVSKPSSSRKAAGERSPHPHSYHHHHHHHHHDEHPSTHKRQRYHSESPSPRRERRHRHRDGRSRSRSRSRSRQHRSCRPANREVGAGSPRPAPPDRSVTAADPHHRHHRHRHSLSPSSRYANEREREDRQRRKREERDPYSRSHNSPNREHGQRRHRSPPSPKDYRSDRDIEPNADDLRQRKVTHLEHRSRRSPPLVRSEIHPPKPSPSPRHPRSRHASRESLRREPQRGRHVTESRARSLSRESRRSRSRDRDLEDEMYNRGYPYGSGYGYPHPSYGHHGFPPSGYYAPSPMHGYPPQHSPHPYQHPPPPQPGMPYYQPRPSRQYSNPPPHPVSQTPQRGGPAMRGGRGHFTNLSWTPGDGVRGGQLVQPSEKSREGSATAPATSKDNDPEDEENPFRPPADLRAEDESAQKKRKISTSTTATAEKSAPVSTKPKSTAEKDAQAEKDKNKISFSIKGRASASAVSTGDKLSGAAKGDTSPLIAKKPPAAVSPLVQSKAAPAPAPALPKSANYVGNKRLTSPVKPSPPPTRKEKVKKRRLKARPELISEYAQSESVYFRKTGNESVVGSGTYGKVFKATHVYTQRKVALKKIRMEGERDGFPVTATREIKLLQSLNHVNVVALQEVMVERNDCFMVFEYLSHDLTGLLNHPTFTLTDAHKKHLAKQMFEGLDYLHRRGVLHRDIKAANILISNTGELKFADFGLARFYQKRQKQEYTNRVITIWYRSPELLLGETQYGPPVDIWSAACVLVEIFTRHAIFPGDGGEINQLDKIYQVLGTPSRSEWPGISELQWYELLRPTHRIPSTLAEKYRDRVSSEAFELLQAMFLYDPDSRPTAMDVLEHPYFTTEEPAPQRVWELQELEGDWHEYESKALRKEKEKQEKEARRRERDGLEKRKAEESADGKEAKKVKVGDEARP